MIVRLALRSLSTRPVRTMVLASGFGLGISVMAVLLGIGEVILDQARAPSLQGGGDVVVSGRFGNVDSARYILSSVLGARELQSRIAAASPSRRATLFLITPTGSMPVSARGGVPSLERAVGDPEVAAVPGWTDRADEQRWIAPDPGDVLRTMDRFHPQPDVPEFADSWAEWLYFNGRSADGRVRFYLTFLAGATDEDGTRTAGVRLQLQRDGVQTNYSAVARVDADTVLARAPDLEIAGNSVRLEGLQYRITLDLQGEDAGPLGRPRLTGQLTLEARPGASLPPAVIQGARGWVTGYVVPVLSGTFGGTLDIGGTTMSLEKASGYHDHNWGFWRDVRWQWGQVSQDDLAFVYGRVFPPAGVADADRIPGFLGVLGPDGPLGVSTRVTIAERDENGQPAGLSITARGEGLNLRIGFEVDRIVRNQLRMTAPGGSGPAPMDFLQLSGMYRVTGLAGGRTLDFSARGAAETFRPH